MTPISKDGGKPVPQGSGIRLSVTPRCSLIAVPVPKTKKPEVFAAKNMDEFLKKVPQVFKAQLRRADGSSVNEKFTVQKYDDLDLDSFVGKSEVLLEQQIQKDFLHRFLHEWQYNPSFREEIRDILDDPERKANLINALRQMGQAMQKSESPLMALLAK